MENLPESRDFLGHCILPFIFGSSISHGWIGNCTRVGLVNGSRLFCEIPLRAIIFISF